MNLIEAENLTFVHPSGRGVAGLSFSLAQGRSLAVLGPNGSGKTTLSRLVCGLLKPASGSLKVFGQPVRGRSTALLARLGICRDSSFLWDNLSGWDNAYFVARSRGLRDREAGEQLEHFFQAAGLADRAGEAVKTYSFGMRRKVCLIQALTGWPELLVLDEPTAGLDGEFIRFLLRHLRARSGHGLTTWLASNDPAFCQKAAESALFMDQGRLIGGGEIPELIARAAPFKEVRLELEPGGGEVDLAGLEELDWLQSIRRAGDSVIALMEDRARLTPMLMDELIQRGAEPRTMEISGGGLAQALEMALAQAGQAKEAGA